MRSDELAGAQGARAVTQFIGGSICELWGLILVPRQ